MVKPDSWEKVGGPGSIREYEWALVISQTGDVHREIQSLLRDLREIVDDSGQRVTDVQIFQKPEPTHGEAIQVAPPASSQTVVGDPFGGAVEGNGDTSQGRPARIEPIAP